MKKIQEYFPTIGIILIFGGYLKLYFFYKHWGINIHDYLEVSEIAFSFLNDLSLYSFFVLIMLLYGGTLGFMFKQITKGNDNHPLTTFMDVIFTRFKPLLVIFGFIFALFIWKLYFDNKTITLLFFGLVYSCQFLHYFFEYFFDDDNELAFQIPQIITLLCVAALLSHHRQSKLSHFAEK